MDVRLSHADQAKLFITAANAGCRPDSPIVPAQGSLGRRRLEPGPVPAADDTGDALAAPGCRRPESVAAADTFQRGQRHRIYCVSGGSRQNHCRRSPRAIAGAQGAHRRYSDHAGGFRHQSPAHHRAKPGDHDDSFTAVYRGPALGAGRTFFRPDTRISRSGSGRAQHGGGSPGRVATFYPLSGVSAFSLRSQPAPDGRAGNPFFRSACRAGVEPSGPQHRRADDCHRRGPDHQQPVLGENGRSNQQKSHVLKRHYRRRRGPGGHFIGIHPVLLPCNTSAISWSLC